MSIYSVTYNLCITQYNPKVGGGMQIW